MIEIIKRTSNEKLIIIVAAIGIVAIVAYFGYIQSDNPHVNGMYSAITAFGALLNGFVLFFLIYEFRTNKRRELSLKEKELLIFFQNNLPDIRVQTYDEIRGQTPVGKTVIVSLHNFSQRTAFKVIVNICKNEHFGNPLRDYIGEFTPGSSMSVTLEDIIDPTDKQPNKVRFTDWANYYSECPHKGHSHMTHVKLTFCASPKSEEYKTTKVYELYLDEVDEGQGKQVIVSRSIATEVSFPKSLEFDLIP